jgi:hypothetical protein
MIVLLRGMAIIVGAGAIGAVTYGTVKHSGGIGSDAAPLYLALGALQIMLALSFGIITSRALKSLAILVLLACEAATFIGTANLQLADVEAHAMPVHQAAARRQEAQAWLTRLENDDRVQRAERALQAARENAMATSESNSCNKGCIATAQQTVADARAALDDARQSLQLEERQARAALNDAPLPGSANVLADKLGLSASTVDLFFVGFRGFAVAIGAAILLAAGAHPRRRQDLARPSPTALVPETVAPARKPPIDQVASVAAPSAKVVKLAPPKPALSVIDFGADSLEHAPGDALDFDEFFNAYVAAAEARKMRAHAAEEFVDPFKRLIAEAGIRTRKRGSKLFLCDVRLVA